MNFYIFCNWDVLLSILFLSCKKGKQREEGKQSLYKRLGKTILLQNVTGFWSGYSHLEQTPV